MPEADRLLTIEGRLVKRIDAFTVRAVANYEAGKYRRVMHRITLAGDTPR